MPTLISVTKYFPKAKEGFVTTLAGSIASGATTVPLTSVSGYANGDVVVLVVDGGLSTQQVFTGTVNTAGATITGVVWTEGTNVTHTNGATVVDYVTATHLGMITTGLLKSFNQDGSLKNSFDVTSATYGAVGDGTTDDSVAIQAAITAAIAQGGGTVLFPAGKVYKYGTTLTIDPITLSKSLRISAYGANLSYSGSSDAILIKTNVAGSDVQHSERSVILEGFKLTGTSTATGGIHNKATNVYGRDLFIENFTKTTSQSASIIMDASFHFWVEECHWTNVDINNTGNGICFISQDDSAGSAASAANNQFSNVHIWLTQAGGKGIYGVGLGATTLVQVARSVFSNIIVHMVNVANLTAFDLTKCYVEGTVFIAPGVDVSGTATTSTGWNYTFSNVLTVLGPTFFPLASVSTKFTGGGAYVITGGNVPSTFLVDNTGQVTAPSINILNNINDTNGKSYITLASTASAVNGFRMTNSATASWPTLSATGTDASVGMYLYPKGSSGQVILADHNVNEVLKMDVGTASAVNEVTVTNAATAGNPKIAASGDDTNIGLDVTTKGTGATTVYTGAKSRKVAIFNDAASSVNWLSFVPTGTGVGASITVDGETNVDLQLYGKGSGYVKVPQKFGVASNSATPAGGTTGLGMQLGTTSNLGIFFGSGVPSLSAAQGSLYIRTDGSSTSTRLYVNTNGTTGWTNVTTAT